MIPRLTLLAISLLLSYPLSSQSLAMSGEEIAAPTILGEPQQVPIDLMDALMYEPISPKVLEVYFRGNGLSPRVCSEIRVIQTSEIPVGSKIKIYQITEGSYKKIKTIQALSPLTYCEIPVEYLADGKYILMFKSKGKRLIYLNFTIYSMTKDLKLVSVK